MKILRKGIADQAIHAGESLRVLLGVSAAILVFGLAASTFVRASIVPVAARKPAPQFNLIDSTGAPVRLADLKGRVVLLDFWATWCHGCIQEIPWFMEFQDKYKSKGFAVIGVSMDDGGWKIVKPFIAAKKMNYPVVLNGEDLDKRYGLGAMPLAVLIDKQGKIADSHAGVVDKSRWESEIKLLLDEKK